MKFRPLHDRVLVRRVEEDTKTAGGIIIPDTAQEKPMQGEILDTGTGSRGENGQVTRRGWDWSWSRDQTTHFGYTLLARRVSRCAPIRPRKNK